MTDTTLTEEEKADLRERLKKLKAAYLSGTASISHNGKSVTFRSMDDLKKAIDFAEDELGIKRTKTIKTVSHRGL